MLPLRCAIKIPSICYYQEEQILTEQKMYATKLSFYL